MLPTVEYVRCNHVECSSSNTNITVCQHAVRAIASKLGDTMPSVLITNIARYFPQFASTTYLTRHASRIRTSLRIQKQTDGSIRLFDPECPWNILLHCRRRKFFQQVEGDLDHTSYNTLITSNVWNTKFIFGGRLRSRYHSDAWYLRFHRPICGTYVYIHINRLQQPPFVPAIEMVRPVRMMGSTERFCQIFPSSNHRIVPALCNCWMRRLDSAEPVFQFVELEQSPPQSHKLYAIDFAYPFSPLVAFQLAMILYWRANA